MAQSGPLPNGVMRSAVPPALFREILSLTDWLLGERDSQWDVSAHLAGRIDRGAQIAIPPLTWTGGRESERRRLFEFLVTMSREYVRWCAPRLVGRLQPKAEAMADRLRLDDAWFVSQLAGDFNPPHDHSGLVSGIIYLKVPPQVADSADCSGHLWFQQPDSPADTGSAALEEHLCFDADPAPTRSEPLESEYRIVPREGDVWLFPSWLFHRVSAFEGTGERRSMSFNVSATPSVSPAPVIGRGSG